MVDPTGQSVVFYLAEELRRTEEVLAKLLVTVVLTTADWQRVPTLEGYQPVEAVLADDLVPDEVVHHQVVLGPGDGDIQQVLLVLRPGPASTRPVDLP